MKLYWNAVFPFLCDLALSKPHIANLRKELLANVAGEILEIGVGTGLNLGQYPTHVRRITAIDPNPRMNRRLMRRSKESGVAVEHRQLGGEQLPFAEDTFDCVVSTFTLCSIPEAGRAVSEVYRVLKPDGQFFFLEHGQSDEPGVRKWQGRLNWLQFHLCGCRLDLDPRSLLAQYPFRSVQIENFYMEKAPKTHGYLYRGMAIKAK